MIQTDRETFQMMLHQIMERFDRIEDRLSRMNRQTSALDGDKLLDNQDMCELLGITKRTLARYRQKKLVTYYMIDGRTYYKSSEVEAFLNQKGRRLPARLKKQMENREVIFSKDSGIIDAANLTLTLSKSERASDYDIRYTIDGSIPRKSSSLYEQPLQLSKETDSVVRAALFYRGQRVSPIYTKTYVTQASPIQNVEVSHADVWGETYTKEKMIDGNSTTRWASKNVDSSKPMEITLTFEEKEVLAQLVFDLFVSNNNGIGSFEIQALTDGEYQTVYEGVKMGDIGDKVGDMDGSSAGYHVFALRKIII